MKRIGVIGVMFFAFALSSCDLLFPKDHMEPVSKVEMSTGGDEPDPDRDQ